MGKKTSSRFLLPLWILGGAAVFRFYFLWVIYDMLNRREYISQPYIPFKSIPFDTLFWPFFLLLEMIIYWILRSRLQNRLWVHIHIWSVFLAMVILPLLYALITFIFDQYNSPDAGMSFKNSLYQLRFYLYWILIGIGHTLFIATIVKSFSPKKETIADEQASGFLDEFAD